MNSASGFYVSYETLQTDIERLVSMKCDLYTIPGYDREDVGQEIRFICLKALEKYDTAKNHSTPFNYLARCVDNRLRNLLRDNGATLPKSQKENPKAIKRVEEKMRLQCAMPIEDVAEDACGYAQPNIFEFVDVIKSRLPSKEIENSFSLLIHSGPSAISKEHLKIIRHTIREIYPDLL